MTELEVDVVRAFAAALTGRARRHLELNYDSIRYVRAACEHHTPAELARICSAKPVGTVSNPAELILYRLRREARLEDNDEGDAS